MKKLVAMTLALLMVFMSVAIAEEIPFSEWLALQDPVVTDVFAEEAAKQSGRGIIPEITPVMTFDEMLSKIISTAIVMVFNFVTRKMFLEKREK